MWGKFIGVDDFVDNVYFGYNGKKVNIIFKCKKI